MLEQALYVYRNTFRPSPRLGQPHVLLALNVVVADSDAEARRLFTSQQLGFISLRRGRPTRAARRGHHGREYAGGTGKCRRALACAVIGAPATVERGIAEFVARHRPDELMLTANVFDHVARMRSFELAAGVLRGSIKAGETRR
jgi:alkanesulfonate monooxygenase SsuD/methylene tetrahydromethanopterin reductase-like flavin-dependent oxidoreductase (luciferase family)